MRLLGSDRFLSRFRSWTPLAALLAVLVLVLVFCTLFMLPADSVEPASGSAHSPALALLVVLVGALVVSVAAGIWLARDSYRRTDALQAAVGRLEREVAVRRRAESALRAQRNRVKTYLDIVEVIVVVLNRNGEITLINPRGCEILGYRESELVGQDWFGTCLPEEVREKVRTVYIGLMEDRGEANEYFENEVLTRAGERRMVAWHNGLLRDRSGNLVGTVSSGEDITERMLTEQRLREREEMLDLTYEHAPAGMATLDLGGRFLRVNRAMCTMLKRSESDLLTQSLTDVSYPEDVARAGASFRHLVEGDSESYVFHGRCVDDSGELIHVDVHVALVRDAEGRPKMAISQFMDRTAEVRAAHEARQHRERLAHVTRLTTMGEMAAGIAHEINQPLTAINTYASAGQRLMDGGRANPEKLASLLEKISGQAQRAGEVIRRLRNFVRGQDGVHDTVDVNELLGEAMHLVEHDLVLSGVDVRLELQRELPPVSVDTVQVQQVILNLVRNACEAMESAPPGACELALATRSDGEFVVVSVADRGSGVEAQHAAQLFDPFFTTKASGTGIGLAISHSIVRSHGGRLWYDPNPDGGSVFCFKLPASVIA